ncbi:MAG: adenine deaminase [Bacteroidales bacterium]|nr:adenine deaminase [Bacteroidales bacterium]
MNNDTKTSSPASPQCVRGNIVDIQHRTIRPSVLTVAGGTIQSIEPLPAEVDSRLLPYVLPGFIDAHIHIESTLLTPSHFAPLAVAHGTVGVVADPHEIANVMGTDGLRFMLSDSKKTLFHCCFMVPSSVPSTAFETAGASLSAAQTARLLQKEDYYGLAEMMNYTGVLSADAEVMAKLAAAQACHKPIDGHAPGLRGDEAR